MSGINEARAQAERDAITPLTFTVIEPGGSCTIAMNNNDYCPELYLEYSTDGGVSWTPFIIGNTKITISGHNAAALLRASQPNICISLDANAARKFILTGGNVSVSGNLNSLLNADTPVDAIPVYCFSQLFADAYSIKQASALELPATHLDEGCYYAMFKGCTSLTAAPALPATHLVKWCYRDMFKGCTALTEAPSLPATQLAELCYDSMFSGCTALTKAPALPAKELATLCYFSMFSGCTALAEAPVLPVTELVMECYSYMFSGCTALTVAPSLPATHLAEWCYHGMFKGCTSLTAAPALPATYLEVLCYDSMFSGCTALTKAPALPAKELARSCYNHMFSGCTSLTEAPALPAKALARSCYDHMFSGCTSLNRLIVGFKAWADDVSATLNWVEGVPQFGEFHCRRGLPRIYDPSHIPGTAPASN